MSRPRSLVTRVGRRGHQVRHALFLRPCKRCGTPFEYCGSCQPGRRYCEECSEPAQVARERRARDNYNDRDSEEGREAHRLEEAERRARRARERVGDRRCPRESDGVDGPALAACPAAKEATDATPSSSTAVAQTERASGPEEPRWAVCPSTVGEGAGGPALLGSSRSSRVEWVEWILVAWPELLEAAQKRLGNWATCPFCGRRGRIVQVVSIDEWRRRTRYGFD